MKLPLIPIFLAIASWLKATFGLWGATIIVFLFFILIFVGILVLVGLWKRTRKGKEETLLWAAVNNETKVLKKLLDRGVNPNVETPEGWTPLMLAASNGNKFSTKLLLIKGASVTARDRNHKSALDHALENGHTGLQTLLSQNNQFRAAQRENISTL